MIGAVGDDSVPGSAYVFERDPLDPTVWTQSAKLTASDGAAGDNFGWVAISGDTAVIGARFDDDLGLDSGSAYVFERDPDDPVVWTQAAKLTASDGAAGDHFGSVAISGDTAVIGAYSDDDLGSHSGSAYVFERDPLDPAVWTQTAKLTASAGAAGDYFGLSVAISGDTAVIGAYLHDNDLGIRSGSAYAYSPLVCELALALEPLELRAGEDLQVAVDLHHRRPVTVTVPFRLWVEDATGQVVVQRSSPPVTMEPGDHLKLRLAVTLPPSLPAGTYQVRVGVARMQQGIAGTSRGFRVIE